MQNVTVKQLDQVLTQLNEVLAKLAKRIEALEEAAEAKPTTTRAKRGTKSEWAREVERRRQRDVRIRRLD